MIEKHHFIRSISLNHPEKIHQLNQSLKTGFIWIPSPQGPVRLLGDEPAPQAVVQGSVHVLSSASGKIRENPWFQHLKPLGNSQDISRMESPQAGKSPWLIGQSTN
jgi:hypothetical protein